MIRDGRMSLSANLKEMAFCYFLILLLTGCSLAGTSPTPTLIPGVSIRSADGMQMAYIPASDTEGLWFDQAWITNGQYLACVEAGRCEWSPVCSISGANDNPDLSAQTMTCARWSDTKAYCEWAGGRLATEAEWDAAALQSGEELGPWGETRAGFRCVVSEAAQTPPWPTHGWITASPAAQGMDEERLATGIAQLEATFPNLHSLLIVRHGYLVVEKYYYGYGPSTYQDVASVNKSFISALIGIAIERGDIPGIDQKMMDYFPDYGSVDLDPRIYEITIEHLLTMTSGFYWPETEPDTSEFVAAAFDSTSPEKALFQSPVVDQPGTKFNYCTACTHVLSIILQEATGMTAQEYAQEYLMDTLGITPESWYWNRTAEGYNTGGWGFWLTPRDMAKLGYLYLNDGSWDGVQVVPEDWARTSRQSIVDVGQQYAPPYQEYRYGYLWWVTTLYGQPAFYAIGHGGQYIYILPTLDTVVVITQETSAHVFGDPYKIIRDYFIPAILEP